MQGRIPAENTTIGFADSGIELPLVTNRNVGAIMTDRGIMTILKSTRGEWAKELT